jgi:AhpD family alkylhydroperoxidase
MIPFEVHTLASAPEGSREALRSLEANAGFIPNLAAAMAESPDLLNGFLAVRGMLQDGTFTPGEVQVLSLTAAFENGCAWCMAFHTFMALREGVSAESVEALRAGRAPSEPRLATLSDFARTMIRQRGRVSNEDLQRFLGAGYTRAQALEVVLGMAFSTMANYAGHLTDPPVDAPFTRHAWHDRQAAMATT